MSIKEYVLKIGDWIPKQMVVDDSLASKLVVLAKATNERNSRDLRTSAEKDALTLKEGIILLMTKAAKNGEYSYKYYLTGNQKAKLMVSVYSEMEEFKGIQISYGEYGKLDNQAYLEFSWSVRV